MFYPVRNLHRADDAGLPCYQGFLVALVLYPATKGLSPPGSLRMLSEPLAARSSSEDASARGDQWLSGREG